MMHHHLQVFMSLKLILFLLSTNGYTIPVMAHRYGLICKAQGIVGSSQRESPTNEWEMMQELQLLLNGLIF